MLTQQIIAPRLQDGAGICADEQRLRGPDQNRLADPRRADDSPATRLDVLARPGGVARVPLVRVLMPLSRMQSGLKTLSSSL